MSGITMFISRIAVITIAVTSVDTFLLSLNNDVDYQTLTHRDITMYGVNRAVIQYLLQQNLVSPDAIMPIQEFFETDTANKEKYWATLYEILSAINSIWLDKKGIAKWTVNGEQILEAHNLVCRLRQEINSLAQKDLTDATRSLILQKIGQALFVVQSFYSNTNWVDISGATVYESFGVCGHQLMPIVSSDAAACKDCTVLTGSNCENTLMAQNELTSGYRSGQDILKPDLQLSRRTIGKCSHGGQHDATRTSTAKGGINKETRHSEYSPMKHLHKDAANAAIEATQFFFIGQDSGILTNIGNSQFMTVLNIIKRKRTSLTFVIDVTGSMRDNIQQVKETCISIVTSVIGTNSEPTKYVLTTFSDPVELTTTFETTDGTDMIAKLSSLSVDGGADCAEYSMDGLLKGLQLSNNHSTVYLITDAPAKDCSEKEQTMKLAQSKNITVRIILPRECSQEVCAAVGARKRREYVEYGEDIYISATDSRFNDVAGQYDIYRREFKSVRHKRSASIYKEIAESTGGALYQPENGIATVLKTLIQSDLSSSEVLVHLFESPLSSKTAIQISVDSGIQLLKIEISGSSAETDASVRNTTGSMQYTLRYFSNQILIITIVNPVSGIWTLEKIGTFNWNVRITAVAVMDISYRLLETDSEGYVYEVQGNPIAGQNYTLEVTIMDVIENATDFNIALIGENGDEVLSSAPSCSESVSGKVCPVTLTVPAEKAYVQLQGRDRDGNLFRRTSDTALVPVSVKLRLGAITSSLYVGVSQALPYTLSNAGSENGTFTVQYINDYFNATVADVNHFLTSGESVDGSFYITGTSDGNIVTYTMSVFSNDNSIPLQSMSRSVVFTSKQHPVCIVINKSGNCNSAADQCSLTSWSTSSQISYSGVTLQSIYLSNMDSSVTMNYDNSTGSPVNVTVSGTCCMTSVYLNVIDDESYSDRCHLQFGDDHRMVMQVSDNSDSQGDEEQPFSSTEIITIVVSCISIFVLALVIAIVIWKCKVKPNTKTGLQSNRYLFAVDTIEKFLFHKESNKIGDIEHKAPAATSLHQERNQNFTNNIRDIEVIDCTPNSSTTSLNTCTSPPGQRMNNLRNMYSNSRSVTMSDVQM